MTGRPARRRMRWRSTRSNTGANVIAGRHQAFARRYRRRAESACANTERSRRRPRRGLAENQYFQPEGRPCAGGIVAAQTDRAASDRTAIPHATASSSISSTSVRTMRSTSCARSSPPTRPTPMPSWSSSTCWQRSRARDAARAELLARIQAGTGAFPYQIALAKFDLAQGKVDDSIKLLQQLIASASSTEETMIAKNTLAEHLPQQEQRCRSRTTGDRNTSRGCPQHQRPATARRHSPRSRTDRRRDCRSAQRAQRSAAFARTCC